jgi:hypothetical protein
MAAPWDGRLATYLGSGLASARPTTPNIAPGILAWWFSTDSEEPFPFGMVLHGSRMPL